jgi:hypothetical protein
MLAIAGTHGASAGFTAVSDASSATITGAGAGSTLRATARLRAADSRRALRCASMSRYGTLLPSVYPRWDDKKSYSSHAHAHARAHAAIAGFFFAPPPGSHLVTLIVRSNQKPLAPVRDTKRSSRHINAVAEFYHV